MQLNQKQLTDIISQAVAQAVAMALAENKPAPTRKAKTTSKAKTKTTRKAAPVEKPVKKAKSKATPKVKENWFAKKLTEGVTAKRVTKAKLYLFSGKHQRWGEDEPKAQMRLAMVCLTGVKVSTELRVFKSLTGRVGDIDDVLSGAELLEDKFKKIWAKQGWSVDAAVEAFEATQS